jgi:hypothetical protein
LCPARLRHQTFHHFGPGVLSFPSILQVKPRKRGDISGQEINLKSRNHPVSGEISWLEEKAIG